MSDYPDPDEEYELQYADELELIRSNDEDNVSESSTIKRKALTAKRSLDFTCTKNAESTTENSKILNGNTKILEDDHISSLDIEISNTPHLPQEQNLPSTTNINNSDVDSAISNNKRTLEELFGDVNDIDFDNINLPSKKQKTEEEIDLEVIEKILEGRRLRQMRLEPSAGANSNTTSYDSKENLSFDIPRWAFVPLTNSDGDRLYVKLESEDSWDQTLEDVKAKHSALHASYAAVWDEARKILENKKAEEQKQATQLTQLPSVESEQTKLWVDKYKPHSYVDLLSEETVNRALLYWLRLWDKIVFKRDVKVKEPSQRTTFNKRAGQFQLTNKWKGKKEAEVSLDNDGRPHHKVALLCGPPGVGKTTLAHLLARIAGYRPVELNASDERSTEAFRNALLSATQMRSVIDAEKRPNCLILDEIDGAPLPTVELLVRWCLATSTDNAGKKKAKVQPLRRPVIAICNDLYAPALRPLRAISLIIHVGTITPQRLANRLAGVCLREGLANCPRGLAALARKANGDIRAAVMLLNFLAAKGKKELKVEDIAKANFGERDYNRSVMEALNSIFTVNDKDSNVFTLANVISAAGEYERIVDGIFENYLTSRIDAHLLTACATLENLRWFDLVNTWIQTRQNYSLYGTLPLCAARCRSLLATRSAQKLKYPLQGQEMYRKRQELDSTLLAIYTSLSPHIMRLSRKALFIDTLSLLPYILSPNLRSNNVQLCSETEKKALHNAAGAMCDYGLQYVQQRTEDGVYAFLIEPSLHRLVFFGNEDRLKTSPALRQAIASEQQLEMIRRCEAQMGKVNITSEPEALLPTPKSKSTVSKDEKTSHLPNHLQRLRPKEITKPTPQVQKDFFGRVVPIIESSQRSDAVRDVISSSSIFYQYQEGFNNAVRRNVRMKDLL